ncbi:MAG: HAMP domain-containing histidine kinase [Acidobacteria bacterium]|nr:HAMP domain-containing histidine kinase [Acidobacteriota bacterium]
MTRFDPSPRLLKLALAAMWLAVVALILLQFQWSSQLGDALEQRLNTSLATAAESFRANFQADLNSLCRAIQSGSPAPQSPLPYRLYRVDATLNQITLLNTATELYEPAPPPTNWAELRDELAANIEDLSTASQRRWFNRPWLASSFLPAFYRATASTQPLDEDTSLNRLSGFDIILLDLPTLSARYFLDASSRAFAPGLIESRVTVSFGKMQVFDSAPNSGTSSTPQTIDLLESNQRTLIRPESGISPWQLKAQPRPGALEAAVNSLRLRNLATGLAVCFVLLAASLFLHRMLRRSQQLTQLQTEFVAGFSHELRTPITAICMLAGNLRDGVSSEPTQIRHYGELILEQGGRLRTRIEDILAFAAGRNATPQLQPVDVPGLLESVLREEASLLKDFQVETHFDPDLPLALADQANLKSVFSNLISNAVKYARKGAWIGITVSSGPKDNLSILIADRGPGIEPADLPRIFEPFFRGRAARTGSTPGSGLGLYLVHSRIQSMGGTITIDSSPGRGTAFTILLRTTS